jgi:hypothetical protein
MGYWRGPVNAEFNLQVGQAIVLILVIFVVLY